MVDLFLSLLKKSVKLGGSNSKTCLFKVASLSYCVRFFDDSVTVDNISVIYMNVSVSYVTAHHMWIPRTLVIRTQNTLQHWRPLSIVLIVFFIVTSFNELPAVWSDIRSFITNTCGSSRMYVSYAMLFLVLFVILLHKNVPVLQLAHNFTIQDHL